MAGEAGERRDYGAEIAEEALDIGAIKLNPNNPFTWASGYRMPIYNDNRMHLRFPKNRKLITDGFAEIIKSRNIPGDFITGTSTAGIAPAASLAQMLDVPLGFTGDSAFMVYAPGGMIAMASLFPKGEYDVIMSTCPFAIAPAVFEANRRGLPFAYVRAKPKAHGTQQQIEGILEKGERVLLTDVHNGNSYLERAIEAIEEKGGVVKDTMSINISKIFYNLPARGAIAVHVEDLISTGGSCTDEIIAWRREGMQIGQCLAIFSYGFQETSDRFSKIGCGVSALLDYNQLLETAVASGHIPAESHEMLKGWRADPFGWGEKHGFPKVEKGEKK